MPGGMCMQNNRFLEGLRRVYARYDRLMEKQGFYIVLAVCVLVILLSALYTFQLRDQWEEPPAAADTGDEALAAGGSQGAQTLSDAKALVESRGAGQLAVPTQAPLRFSQPVNGFTDRGFSVTEPQYFSKTGVWQVHPGIDLQVAYGEVVKACGAGTVDAVWEDNQLGLCVRLNHEDGYQSLYAGLSNADYVRAGDPVAQGQTIGHAGNGVLAESDAEPHLHLEIWKDGRPVDPIAVFLGVDN